MGLSFRVSAVRYRDRRLGLAVPGETFYSHYRHEGEPR